MPSRYDLDWREAPSRTLTAAINTIKPCPLTPTP